MTDKPLKKIISTSENVGKPLNFPVYDAEEMGIQDIVRDGKTYAALTFTIGGHKVGFAIDEDDVANLMSVLQNVLKDMIADNHPKGGN